MPRERAWPQGLLNEDVPRAPQLNQVDKNAADAYNLAESNEGRVDDLETDVGVLNGINKQQIFSQSTVLASSLTNLSSVTELQISAVKLYDTWVGTIEITAEVSGSGFKNLEVSLPSAAALTEARRATGAGTVGLADHADVEGIDGTSKMLIRWNNSQASGPITVRCHFSYFES